jgi:hypothetical protein
VPPGVTVTVVVLVGVNEGASVGVNVGTEVTEGDGVRSTPALTVFVGLVSSVHTARISVSAEKMRNGTYNLHLGPTFDHTGSYVMKLRNFKVTPGQRS